MFPVINDIIRLVCLFTLATQPDVYSNTYHFKVITDGWISNLAFMLDIAGYLDASYTLVNGEISTGVQYVSIDAQNLTQSVLMPLVPWPVLTVGANASETLPTQVTARPYFPTTRPKTRAAIGLVPFGETSQSGGGLLDATAIAAIEAFADRFVGTMVLSTGTLAYGAYNALLARFTQVDSRVVPDRFRTLRRRRAGVGS